MQKLLEINGIIGSFVWGWPMMILLLGTGLLLTVRTKGRIFTKFGFIMNSTFLNMFKKSNDGEGEVSAFQAVSTALAATVGTGNIAGVALAIALGGPGAVFWMWLSALLGMTTKFSEVILSITYRVKHPETGEFSGGPMYYISRGTKLKWLAVLFAIFGMLASFGIGNMTQANSIADALRSAFSIPPLYTGIVIAVITAVVILGGIKRIGSVTEKLVPFMAAFYILGALIIIILNIGQVPHAFALIFGNAFTGHAAVGGFAGSTLMLSMRYGIARGIFTNEAGLGSAPIAHAAATTDHPVRQGMWGVFEVFVDTIMVCSMTALVVLVSGEWTSGLQGAALTTAAFQKGMPGGNFIVAIGLTLFAFSTILGWSYYGEKCTEYLFGPKAVIVYRVIYVPVTVIGAIGGLEQIWAISDTLNGLMAIPNLVALLMLSGVVVKMIEDFFKNPNKKRSSDRDYLDLLEGKFRVPEDM